MATIDKLDISVYNLYAMRTRMIEQINQQYHLDQAGSIPPQTFVIHTNAQLTELDLLLGVVPLLTPWAYFFPPQRFRTMRRTPFSFSKVAPSMGTPAEQEKALAALQNFHCSSPEEESEKKAIMACFKQMDKINNWLSFIVGRIGQFLQG
jgi:hypothetical protein